MALDRHGVPIPVYVPPLPPPPGPPPEPVPVPYRPDLEADVATVRFALEQMRTSLLELLDRVSALEASRVE